MTQIAHKEASNNETVVDRDAKLRTRIADIIMAHATRNNTLTSPQAIREVCRVTGRSNSTVKSWLHFKATFPDLGSLARIINHYKIPREAVLPDDLADLVEGDVEAAAEPVRLALGEEATYSFYAPNDPSSLDRALLKYTEAPRHTLFVKHDSSDMLDQIRPGELMLVDPTCEEITGAGIYMLRFSMPNQPTRSFVRNVEPLMSEPAVRISGGSASTSRPEVIQLVQGRLPPHVSVLFRVIGVVRQT